MLDATASFANYISNGQDYIITRDTLLSGFEMYLQGNDPLDQEASPLWRDDFNGLRRCISLPPNTIRSRDEGEALYERLTRQGVTCTCLRYHGVIHGFFQLGGVSQAARDAMEDVARRVAGH